MNAGFVGKSVLADNGFILLDKDSGNIGKEVSMRIDLLGDNLGIEVKEIAPGTAGHDKFLERSITGPLSDPVDRALDLACPILAGGDGVGHSQP